MDRPRRNTPEHDQQVIVAQVLMLARIPFSASLSGVNLTKAQRGMAKARGVQAGEPDVIIHRPPPAHPGLIGMAVEMKTIDLMPSTDRAMKWSGAQPHQRERLQELENERFLAVVGYGADDAIEKIRAAGYPLPLMPRVAR